MNGKNVPRHGEWAVGCIRLVPASRTARLRTLLSAALVFCWIAPCHLYAAQDAAMPDAPPVSTRQGRLPADLSAALIDTTMRLHPQSPVLGKWGYIPALFLFGEYRVYQRTHNPRALAYIRAWADAHVDEQGHIDNDIQALDYMLPGNLMLALYRETGLDKYKIAAQTIRHRLDTYPRTSDGGLWHATSRQHQLWLDGTYMSLPFFVRYGEMFGDRRYTDREAVRQLLLYARHLNDPKSGLLFHAYDESGTQPWLESGTHHSSVFWARSIGWYGMALVDVLQTMPHNQPGRPRLMALVRQLARAYAKYQDPTTGLWYDVVDQPTLPHNWLETSASSMYVYTLSKAVQLGYIPYRYDAVACAGYRGVLSQISVDADGNLHIANIGEGTNVGHLDYYLARAHPLDDLHGLGAFLLMNEQMRGSPCAFSVATAGAQDAVRISRPLDFEVFQRRSRVLGHILVRGQTALTATSVEARLSGTSFAGLLPATWHPVTLNRRTGVFQSDLATPAGGFYSLQVRTLRRGYILGSATVDHVGVGEVFVISGQSNSTNYGEVQQVTATQRVSTFDGQAWRLANDPQPGVQDNSSRGSFIPAFGDELVRRYRVPIGIASVGHGSTSVRQWLPPGDPVEVMPTMTKFVARNPGGTLVSDGTLFNGMMMRVHELGVHGFRALLWHQGESDATQSPEHTISPETYRRMLQRVISATRLQAGWRIPWMVAEASYHSPSDPLNAPLREAQRSLWTDGTALRGPDTDTLTAAYRQNQGKGVHFNDAGLQAHGRLWAQRVEAYLDSQLTRR